MSDLRCKTIPQFGQVVVLGAGSCRFLVDVAVDDVLGVGVWVSVLANWATISFCAGVSWLKVLESIMK